jgi:ABC-type phosphate/phosphonate transport system substrate-binding protein
MITSSHAQAQTRQLSFGIFLTQSAENLQAGWQALLDHRQKSAGLTSAVVIAPD